MSRRKQRKPQQLISDCDNSTSSENGDTAGEDVQVCRKCCAQFDEPSDFTRHKESCLIDNQVVVIVENQGESGRKNQQVSISEESHSRPSSTDSVGSGKKTMVTEQYEKGTSSQVMGCMRSEMDKKGVGPSQRFLIPNGGMIMEGMSGPKVGLAPMSQEAIPGCQSASAPINIPMILEELRVLQQRQIRQMQITEQICQQVLMLGSLSMTPSSTATSSPERATSTKTLPVFSPSKQSEFGPESAKTFCKDETSKQTFLHLYNHMGQTFGTRSIPNMKDKLMSGFCDKSILGQASLPSSPQSQIISPHAIFPPSLPNLPGGLFLGARVLENAPTLLKQKNNDSLRGEIPQERASGKHKCRFCAKVFGSDSALQIHLRSHTGERPYKCNICGNRFTTRGNLKVHFHRHREKYPHIQMNPHPVPEHLDYVLTSSGLPYGMSVPPEKAEEETIDKKPVVAPIMTTDSLNLFSSSGNQGLQSINKLVLMKAEDSPSALKTPIVCPNAKSDENTPPVERTGTGGADVTGRMQLSKLVTSLPSWALLASHFKSGNFPFSYAVEPLGYSETSKLQQLVEKIDKQATVPNQCVICLRVLSCPRALRLHYNQHGGERPFKCKICGRAFSTKGNLKAHFVGHKSSLSSKPQNSCPICQKKFTNAVTLQQHIRMHLGGQIPNGDMTHRGGNKTDSMEDKTTQELSEDISTDEDSLDASESESEKAALVESEISSMEDDIAASAVKIKDEDKLSLVPIIGTETVIPSETNTMTKSGNEVSVPKKTSEQLSNEEDKPEANQSPDDIDVKSEAEQINTESKQDSETDISKIPEGSPKKEDAHICDLCSDKLPNVELLAEHMKCHTKDGLFHCLVCKQSFLEASTLTKHVLHAHQVHMSTHVWNNSSSRRGRRLSLDNLGPLLSGNPVKLQDFLSRDIPTQLVGVSPLSFWNQYTTYITSGPPLANGNITSTTAVISPPVPIGLQATKVGHIPVGTLEEVKEKKPGGAEALFESPVKEEK